jgi:PhnB protein
MPKYVRAVIPMLVCLDAAAEIEFCKAAIARAVAAGARILTPPADQSWGDPMGRIVDPSGHVWNVTSRVDKNSKER